MTSKEIQPGSTASIPVTIKPGLGSGDHRFGFQVGYRTSRGRSHTRFYLKCKLRPEWEIKRLGEIDPTVRLGNTAVFRYEIICRKLGLEGRLCPDRIEAEQPLQADFDAPCSPGEEQRASTATPIIIEVRRRFHVVVPGEAPKNGRAPLIKLSWNDSPPIEHPVPYRISRPIHWNPRALVIQREEFATAVEITLESLDLAFRVTGVDAHPLMGPASYSMEPSRKQTIRIETRDRGEGPRISSLVIRLDHPEQSEVSIPVLFQ
ncbi:MAG: hypothetical protein SFX72_09985 [Isosphaeraceae bacterium]|nr:hypothetical protein [Isosphaeraceae bacterium]